MQVSRPRRANSTAAIPEAPQASLVDSRFPRVRRSTAWPTGAIRDGRASGASCRCSRSCPSRKPRPRLREADQGARPRRADAGRAQGHARAAAGYLVLGRDLIPDSIPLIGGLDDLVIVVLAVDVFLDGVPPELLQEKLDDLAIDRVAFDRDVAQIRRLTPGPVRRTIRRVPGLITAAGRAVERSGIGPRTRAWINKEEPTT